MDHVDEFLQCGKDTEYDVVHLLTALDLKDIQKDANHEQMTAVIRYKTPYEVDGKGPFILSFALGNDASLRSVLGLPTLLVMNADINLVKGLLSCIELNRDFPLDFQIPDKGLPKGASLNHYSPTVPLHSLLICNLPLHFYIIHRLRVFHNTKVCLHIRTIFLLQILSFIIQSHGNFHTSLLTLQLDSLSN